MPKAKLTKSFINSINTKEISKKIDYFDTEIKGLILRVSPSGTKSYRLKYYIERKPKIYTIGQNGAITLTQAKSEAQRLNSLLIKGESINTNINNASNQLTFKEYLDTFYIDWYSRNRKCLRSLMENINSSLTFFFNYRLEEIDTTLVNKYIKEYKYKKNCSNARINRIISTLKGAISRAAEYNYIRSNKLINFKSLGVTRNKIRYLNDEENFRFFKTLNKQTEMFKNIVTIAYYSGMRRGEILSLKWEDIDLTTNQIVLEATNTKSNKSRLIPIHQKISKFIKSKNHKKGLIFTSDDGLPITQINRQWKKFILEAEIENFRFHDLRHNFCSILVMKGTPIYTVSQLAGHADVKTTQIYAHLSPDVKKSAIDLL
ncbi:site-specific integrase [Francisella sp. 19X1-34]|uniref:site-specific integrase n=1 Tax=Francisella sp. 19X1-34 TaxID=3087177 RepID=UPI002E3756C2|nr:site-specific integrase [Francisella sp. 19X1-34]MED7788382.1 site-specific integrase [Francisella sp. 19X1-34]